MKKQYQIATDSVTVWVNGVSCLGRFGRLGIDIHRSITDEQKTKGECLFCTHGETTVRDWYTFVEKMYDLHHIVVPARYKPIRFKKAA